jgi:hypothetical protein
MALLIVKSKVNFLGYRRISISRCLPLYMVLGDDLSRAGSAQLVDRQPRLLVCI